MIQAGSAVHPGASQDARDSGKAREASCAPVSTRSETCSAHGSNTRQECGMTETTKPDFAEFHQEMANEPVFVILGVQGSGTNLLSNVMRRVFDFSVIQDRSLIYNLAVRLGSNPSQAAIDRAFHHVVSRLFPTPFRKRFQLKHYHHQNRGFVGIEQHRGAVPIKTGADFARFFYVYQAWTLGKRRLATKSDDIWEHLGAIDQVLPNRKIVLITRDFRDNLLSISNKNFGPVEPACVARFVKEQFTHYDREFRSDEANSMHVKYEDMLQSPATFVVDFSKRFGFTPGIEPDRVVEELKIRTENFDKWKKLPARQLARCEGILRDELERYGYKLSLPNAAAPTPGEMLLLGAKDVAWRIPQRIRATIDQMFEK
jgi:Sulfotransferase family